MFRVPLVRFTAALSAILLAGILAGTARAADGHKVVVAAFGLWADQSVFESEAKGAADILAKRFGGTDVVVRANSRWETQATNETVASTLDAVAKSMDAENDILLVIFTSHGSRGGLAVKSGYTEETLSPWLLQATLRYTGVRHKVIIVSACYSGIFIPLAGPDTLVITAADATHPSFGCRDGAEWTYFGDAFFNTAMRRATSLREAFNVARKLVRKRELSEGFEPSNPQIAGGQNIDRLLTAPAPVPVPAPAPPAARRSGEKRPVAAESGPRS
ncbi:MAG: peptidase C13, legumain asparaginyl peptidase [Xanthobacteraceae bacterium]|nr:peptidase C13, legumain asparaginyl peptidase [Xanthobacteraceae bacterium]